MSIQTMMYGTKDIPILPSPVVRYLTQKCVEACLGGYVIASTVLLRSGQRARILEFRPHCQAPTGEILPTIPRLLSGELIQETVI
jgi:hypothetical protein